MYGNDNFSSLYHPDQTIVCFPVSISIGWDDKWVLPASFLFAEIMQRIRTFTYSCLWFC